MALSFVADRMDTFGAGVTTFVNGAFPTGWAAGDLCIWVVADGDPGGSTISSTSAGWTQIGATTVDSANDTRVRMYWRELQSGDTPPSTVYNIAPGGNSYLYLVRGHDSAAPIEDFEIAGKAAATSHTTTAVTVAGDDRFVVSFINVDGTTQSAPFYTHPAGTTERQDFDGQGDNMFGCAEEVRDAGNYTHLWSWTPSEPSVAGIIVIKPGAPTLTRVTSTRQLAWHINTKATSTRQLRHHIEGRVLSERGLAWSIEGRVLSERGLAWSIEGRVLSERGLAWSIETRALSSRQLRWEIAARVAATRQLRWAIDSRVASTRQLEWLIDARVTSTRQLRWEIAARVASTRQLQWQVDGRPRSTRTIYYLIDGVQPRGSTLPVLYVG